MSLFDRLFGSSSGKNKPGKGESQPQGVPDRSAVIKKLLKMLNNDPSIRVRFGATDALGNIGDPSAVLPLYQAIYSGRTDTRGIQALGQIGDANAIKYLELIAADKKFKFGNNVATNVLNWKRHPEVAAVKNRPHLRKRRIRSPEKPSVTWIAW